MRGEICAIVYIGILLVSIDASVPLQLINQKIFHEPVPERFHTSEKWPEYEAVPIDQLHISKRSVGQSSQKSSLRMKPFDDNILEWIQPSDWALFTLDTPVYSIRNTSNGIKYFVYQDVMKIYEPYINMEYISTYNNDRKKRQIDEIKLEDLVKVVPIENRIDDITGRNNESEGSSRTKRSYGDVIYPEILVIVDYDTFELHGKNLYNLLKYLHGFWNGVDLEFRSLESPKFRLNIVAILIDESNIGLSYISSNKLKSEHLEAHDAMTEFASWAYDNLKPIIDRNKYDLTVTMTPLPMCSKHSFPDPCVQSIVGLANMGSACNMNHQMRTISKIALVHDEGAFDGIHTAAHELGHLFGADHDSEPPTYQCNSINGSVMNSERQGGTHVGGWSQCARDAMEKFIKTNGRCLWNEPELNHKFNPYLPGKIKNADKQCEVLDGTNASEIDAKICQSRFCYKRNSNYRKSITRGRAPPGTRCGSKKICVNFKCVTEPEVNFVLNQIVTNYPS